VNLALTVRHGARSRKGVIPEYGWVSGSNSDAEFAGGRFAAATEKAAENCNGHGNCYSARRAASATIETDRSDSTSRTQSVELIGRKRLKRPDVIATGTDRATGPFEKGRTASGDQCVPRPFSFSRGSLRRRLSRHQVRSARSDVSGRFRSHPRFWMHGEAVLRVLCGAVGMARPTVPDARPATRSSQEIPRGRYAVARDDSTVARDDGTLARDDTDAAALPSRLRLT